MLDLESLSAKTIGWYRPNRRELPWRSTRDPYAIWISEIMLQQTQVATVIPYYLRFLERFPTPRQLAAADIEEVLRLWAGLGYYRRARQLHAAAKQIVECHQGIFPTSLDDVLALPGVGRYTAHAILSFALDQSLGIVEANTQRLYARLLRLTLPPQSTDGQRQLWDFAQRIMPSQQCGEFNQAMMEIGSQVCTPRNPSCLLCPFREFCPTHRHQETDQIPAPKPKKQYTSLLEAAVLVLDARGRVLIRQCQPGERWEGLWDFPRFDITDISGERKALRFLEDAMQTQFGVTTQLTATPYELKHAVTRYRITLRCYRAAPLAKGTRLPRRAAQRWISLDDARDMAWNASAKRVLAWLVHGRFDAPINQPPSKVR